MLDRYRVKALIRSSLNEIAPLVGFVIVFDRRFAVRSRRDHGLDASLGQIGAELTSILIKIVARVRAFGNLVRLILLPGPRRDSVGPLIEDIAFGALPGGKAFDYNQLWRRVG